MGTIEIFLKYKTIILYSALILFVLSIFALIAYQRSEIKTLKENEAKLQLVVDTQNVTIDKMKVDFAAVSKTKAEYAKAVSDLAKQRERLMRALYREQSGKLSLEQLIAKDKKNRVEGVINRATEKVLRCIEIESGSPLRKGEKTNCSK